MSKRHPKRKPLASVRTGETSTKERRAQDGGIIIEVIDRDYSENPLIIRHKAHYACKLDRYYAKLYFEEPEYKAGIRFQHAYLRAVLRVKVEDVGGGSQGDYEMAVLTVIKSERLLREAYAVLTPTQKAVLISVCGHDDYAGHPNRMEALVRGLKKLADLWKL